MSSKGSDMFVEYYGYYSYDEFRATIRSKKGTSKFSRYVVYRKLPLQQAGYELELAWLSSLLFLVKMSISSNSCVISEFAPAQRFNSYDRVSSAKQKPGLK